MVSRLIAEPSPSADGGAIDVVDGEMEVHVVTDDDDGAPAVAAEPQVRRHGVRCERFRVLSHGHAVRASASRGECILCACTLPAWLAGSTKCAVVVVT
eukprot:54880-Eustigmatos_ZCMA.PRE.1